MFLQVQIGNVLKIVVMLNVFSLNTLEIMFKIDNHLHVVNMLNASESLLIMKMIMIVKFQDHGSPNINDLLAISKKKKTNQEGESC